MSHRSPLRTILGVALTVAAVSACSSVESGSADSVLAGGDSATGSVVPNTPTGEPTPLSPVAANGAPAVGATLEDGSIRAANELGRIMVLEYHLVGDKEARWEREASRFRKDLELLYARGYRPVSAGDFIDRKLDLPAGLSPVVFTFDDASPSQFRYIEQPDGSLTIDPTSAVGIWMDFAKNHPDWENKAVFCMLSGAEAGRSFFGNKEIEGQKSDWRFQKVKFLHDQGFELCNHTLWHANLGKYDDAFVQEQIARGVLAIDSVVPGYKVRTFALPLGVWPKNRALAFKGEWKDPKSGKITRYDFDSVLEVSGGPTRSPHDPRFERPAKLNRVQVYANELENTLDQLDRNGDRYVSDGDPNTVVRPQPVAAATASGM